ncbi:hypothetical protein CR513_10174, partial [Mucuna pruriens]
MNLISISSLDKFGFSYSFGNNKVSLYQNSNVVGSSSLIDNLYMFDVVSSYNEILQTSSQGHISKQRIERLVLDERLEPLDLSNFEVCVECIKGKRTYIRKLGAKRVKDILELIHTGIVGLTLVVWSTVLHYPSFGGSWPDDDYSRYDYLYLVHEKSKSLDVFNEYYDRYDKSGERPRPFALFLKEYGIAPLYTMLNKSGMNNVIEQQN